VHVGAIRYFSTMGIHRLGIEEAKNYWFANDLVVYALGGENDYEVIALPKIEVERGMKYLNKLKKCGTYGEAQKLYIEFSNDPHAPKLIPRIENLYDHNEELFDLWHVKQGQVNDKKDPSIHQLLESIENDEFNWNISTIYLDENNNFKACRNEQIWTDEWMPLEIANALGTPDTGYGIDYYEAELLYKDKDRFVETFRSFGITVLFDHPELRELVGY
jgi:hypothetical protein